MKQVKWHVFSFPFQVKRKMPKAVLIAQLCVGHFIKFLNTLTSGLENLYIQSLLLLLTLFMLLIVFRHVSRGYRKRQVAWNGFVVILIHTVISIIKIILPYCRTELPRNKGGLGKMKIPILSDLTKDISRDYGILLEAGMSLRYVNILGTIVVTVWTKKPNPAGNYMFKVNYRNTRTRCERCTKSKMKTLEDVSLVLFSLLLTLNIFYTMLHCFYF